MANNRYETHPLSETLKDMAYVALIIGSVAVLGAAVA